MQSRLDICGRKIINNYRARANNELSTCGLPAILTSNALYKVFQKRA